MTARPSDATAFRSVCQILAAQARSTPDGLAIVDGDATPLTRAALADAVARMALALAVLGIRTGMRVGLECPDRLVHLTLLLACEALGAASASLSPADLPIQGALASTCDRVLFSDAMAPGAPGWRYLSASWLDAVRTLPLEPGDWSMLERPGAPGTILRVVRTSGTTGSAKLIEISAAAQAERFRLNYDWDEKAGPICHLSLYPFTFQGGVTRCCATLMHGGSVVFGSLARFVEAVDAHGCNAATLLVGDAGALLNGLPAGWRPKGVLELSMVGADLPRELRRLLLDRLASSVVSTYSSNEVGVVGRIDASGCCTVAQGVDIAIRDESGAELAAGAEGLIWVRSASLPQGYENDPQATTAAFRDGWFLSNDWGYIDGTGQLRVLGRADAMLNIGGRKVPVEPIEAALRELDGVNDAALVSFPGPQHVDVLAVMLEVRPEAGREAVFEAATRVLEAYVTCHLALTDQLPRTDTRKVRKSEVIAWFRRDLGLEPG